MLDKNTSHTSDGMITPDYEAMVIGAHPDDGDIATAGVSALWTKGGEKIVWVIMTNGVEGSEILSLTDTELMLVREHEQRMACESLAVQAVEFLRFPDGHLLNSKAARKAIVRLIRNYRPRVIFTHDPTVHIFTPYPDERPDNYINHPDHRATGNIVLDAIYPAANNLRSYRELVLDGLLPYQVHELYLFFAEDNNTYIDITEVVELKAKCLQCHTSQFGPMPNMLDKVHEWGAEAAEEARENKGLSMLYAEAFRRVKLYIPKRENPT